MRKLFSLMHLLSIFPHLKTLQWDWQICTMQIRTIEEQKSCKPVVEFSRQSALRCPRIIIPPCSPAWSWTACWRGSINLCWARGRTKINVKKLQFQSFLEYLVLHCLEKNNLSARNVYNSCTDAELDDIINNIKDRMPRAGYQLFKGSLNAQGHHVGWDRVRAPMHQLDSIGILSRMTQLGCTIDVFGALSKVSCKYRY